MKKLNILLIILMIVAPLVCGFVWINDSSKCKIIYELDGGVNSPLNQTEYLKTDGIIILEDASKDGYDFLGWYLTEDFAEESKVTELDVSQGGEITVHAKFIQVLYYSASGSVLGITDYGRTKTEIVIPASCTEIEMFAFKGAVNLESIIADHCENLKTIKMAAFEDCTKLTSITLPKNLENIEGRAFNAKNIGAIKFPNGSNTLAIYNGSIVNKNSNTLVLGGVNGFIPDGIERVGAYAFGMNKEVKKIVLPDSVKVVESHAFANCHNLEELIISDSSKLEVVEKYAFAYLYNVKEINLPDGVKTINNGAFANCKKMQSFRFPKAFDCKVLSDSILYGCESLTSIVIPEGVEEIGWDTFANCKRLTEIVIPSSVKRIDGDAFRDCHNLKNVYIDGDGDWIIKPDMQKSFAVDAKIIANSEMLAKALATNYMADMYMGNSYTRFVWIKK